MTEVRAKRARLGHGSVVRAARILATGLVCYGVGVRAEVKTPMTETASVDYRRDSGSKLVLPSARSGAEDILRSSVIVSASQPKCSVVVASLKFARSASRRARRVRFAYVSL